MAVTEVKEALRSAASRVAAYIKDAGVLTVETQVVEVAEGSQPELAARTVIKLDGDNVSTIPAVRNADGKWEVDTVLHDLHMKNVQAAIEYRSKLMSAMLSLLRSSDGT